MAIPTANKGELLERVDTSTALNAGLAGHCVCEEPDGSGVWAPDSGTYTPSGAAGDHTLGGAGTKIAGILLADMATGDGNVSFVKKGAKRAWVSTLGNASAGVVGLELRCEADSTLGVTQDADGTGGFIVAELKEGFSAAQLAAGISAGDPGLYVLVELTRQEEVNANA